MTDPLLEWEKYEAFTEAYEIVKSVEIVGQNHNIYRIDIKQDYAEEKSSYIAEYYIKEGFTVQPTYPQTDGKFDRRPEDTIIWRVLSFMPTVQEATLEKALTSALRFLAECTKRPNPEDRDPKDEKIIKLFKSDKDKE